MELWDFNERLSKCELSTSGGKSEAWVKLIGTEGAEVAFPAAVLFQAASILAGSMLSHAEDSSQGFTTRVTLGLDD